MAKKSNVNPQKPTQAKPVQIAKAHKPEASASRWEPANWLVPALVALAITAILYLPTLGYDYVNWDDDPNITENENLQHIDATSLKNIFSLDKGNVIGNYNPLPIFTFALEKMMAGGFSPRLTHFFNILLHLGVVFLVIRLLLHCGISTWGAFVGGLLFGIHPMRVESVAWATERKDVLFALFFFWALMYYVRWIKMEGEDQRKKYYILMLVLAVLSCLSKVQAVTLPLAMLTLDYWFNRPLNFQRILEKAPFWVLSILTGLANIYTLNVTGSTDDSATNFNLGQRLCVGAYSFCTYLYKLVVPYPMSPIYPYPKELPTVAYFAPIGFLAVVGLVWWLWKNNKGKVWIFGILFFFFNVMFVLQVFAAGQGYKADRFTYVPYFGFFFVAAYFYDQYAARSPRPALLTPMLGVGFALCALLTFKQLGIWKNGETLWTHVIGLEGKNISLPYGNRAQVLRKRGDFDNALRDYTTAITISPDKPEHYNSRGKTYFDKGMSGKYNNQTSELVQKSIADYNKGLSLPDLKPKAKSEMLANRGAATASIGNYQQAIQDLSESLVLQSDNKNAYLNRSLAYFSIGQYAKAIEDHTKILEYDPYNGDIYYERGMSKRILGNYSGAVEDLSKSLKFKPNQPLPYLERARSNFQLGNTTQARQDADLARKLGAQMDQQELQKFGL